MQGKELEITRLFLEKQTEGARHCDDYLIDPVLKPVTVGAARRERETHRRLKTKQGRNRV